MIRPLRKNLGGTILLEMRRRTLNQQKEHANGVAEVVMDFTKEKCKSKGKKYYTVLVVIIINGLEKETDGWIDQREKKSGF